MTRILEEQHLKLRSESLSSQRRVAQRVAAEIMELHPPEAGVGPSHDDAEGAASGTGGGRRMLTGMVAVLAVVAGVLGAVGWHLQQQLDVAEMEITRMNTASRNEIELLAGRTNGLNATLQEQTGIAHTRQRAAVDSMAWALNNHSLVAFDSVPFNSPAADRLDELLERLQALDFTGVVTVEARLAAYCLNRDGTGLLQLAPDELPVEACETLGHPLAEGASLAALQTPDFAAALEDAAELPGIELRLTRVEQSAADAAFASDAATAGAWNRMAATHNRLAFRLSLDEPAQVAGHR
jgi:hypothetical protein